MQGSNSSHYLPIKFHIRISVLLEFQISIDDHVAADVRVKSILVQVVKDWMLFPARG